MMISKHGHECYIALGSNINEPLHQIQTALKNLSCLENTLLLKSSPLYQSKPWGYTPQNDFLNAVACLKTLLTPEELLKSLKDIEIKQGRVRTFKNGPRSIDLDLILYGNIEKDTPYLKLPHPKFHERNFVLVPLFDINPDLILPNHLPLKHLVSLTNFEGLIPIPVSYSS